MHDPLITLPLWKSDGLYFYMSSGHITVICIEYHLSSVAEGRDEIGKTRGSWLKEGIHLKADADVGELELSFMSGRGWCDYRWQKKTGIVVLLALNKTSFLFYFLKLIVSIICVNFVRGPELGYPGSSSILSRFPWGCYSFSRSRRQEHTLTESHTHTPRECTTVLQLKAALIYEQTRAVWHSEANSNFRKERPLLEWGKDLLEIVLFF